MSSPPSRSPNYSKRKKVSNKIRALFASRTSQSSESFLYSPTRTSTADTAVNTPDVEDGKENQPQDAQSQCPPEIVKKDAVLRILASDAGRKTSNNFKEDLSLVWDGVKTALQLLRESSDACPPLKSAVGGLLACLELTEAVVDNHEEYEKLALDLTDMAEALTQHVPELASENLNGSLGRIMKSIEEESKRIRQQQDRGIVKRILVVYKDQEDVIQRYRRIESLFRRLHTEVSFQTRENTRKLLEKNLLDPVDEARYNSGYSTTVYRRGCTPETREKILEDLRSWAVNPEGVKMYWMNGMAGTGKTTISYSFCKWLEENGRLGGNYFCSRASHLCRTVDNIIPTLAYQLTQYFPAFGSALCRTLHKNPEVSKLDIPSQFKKLIQEPLQIVNPAILKKMVIVVDGLDECDDGDAYQLFLDTLMRSTLSKDVCIKFFLTSRPEPAIRKMSEKISETEKERIVMREREKEQMRERARARESERESEREREREREREWEEERKAEKEKLMGNMSDSEREREMEKQKQREMERQKERERDQEKARERERGREKERERDREREREWEREMLSEPTNVQSVLHLHEIEESIVEADIRLYLAEALQYMSPPPWLSEVEELAKRSGKLFIYAATAVRYIYPSDITVDSRSRLETVLGIVTVNSGRTKQYDELNKLYFNILSAAVNHERLEKQEVDDILFTLRTAVCAKEPMTIQTLASLLSLTVDRIYISLQPLQSVLHVQEGRHAQGLVAPFHASFPDFLFDSHRSGKFHCRMTSHNEILANHCFDLMKKELKFNICGLKSSFVFDRDVPDLPKRIKDLISTALSYASRYWAEHFLQGNLGKVSYDSENLLDFLTHRLLFWMEVLNLEQCITTGVEMLQKVRHELRASDKNIWQQLVDAESFVTQLADKPCLWSTPHIYVSGLAFCPKTNSVYKNYWGCTQGLIDVKSSVFEALEMEVNSVALSPDGSRIVSGSDDHIQVWEAHTGKALTGPLRGHTAWISSVAFSPNNICIVSGSGDYTIRVWNACTGDAIVGPLKGHTAWVSSVAFSHDGTLIVSGSGDCTILVWDTCTGETVAGPFKGHTNSVNSVAFSHDDIYIVSGSHDQTVRVWDTQTGDSIAEPFIGHTGPVNSVAFSSEGTCIASGSDDATIRLWDAQTGDVVIEPLKGHTYPVNCVAFSPDGTCIASCSADRTILVWDTCTGETVAGPFKGHTNSVISVAFSQDGARIVSGSTDCTIRMWDVHVGLVKDELSSTDISISPFLFFHQALLSSLSLRNFTFQPNGWIFADGVPFLWISPRFHTQVLRPGNTLIISPRGTAVIIYSSHLFIGKEWSQCYC